MSAKTEIVGLVTEIEMSKGQVVPLGRPTAAGEHPGNNLPASRAKKVPTHVSEFIRDLFAVFPAGGNSGKDAEVRAAKIYARHLSAFDADTLALALDVLCEYRKEAFRPTIAEVLNVCRTAAKLEKKTIKAIAHNAGLVRFSITELKI